MESSVGICQEAKGPIRSCWDSARTPRNIGFSGSAALWSLLHYKGQCYMSIPNLPVALLERCYVLKRTETNQQSAAFPLTLHVRDPGTAEDPALQTAELGCLVRAKRGEKAAWQNQLSQLRNAIRSN